ncbi:polynucleotide adenylyltransferase PcnB [Sulfurirhabdus autotrophica]|uniref:Poly(A) polymerase I n=1 Tax=Sulfurirhabdus autotrophica TaxID=1706046 RepID=A0A4R3Y2G1_9PROT|nr:polynucleotide adenylyltransferase PcnB [Sulfurirhabdus autotrophica]TCV85880.1 poly(A) polymerase [Sulfurirhabdus autotrophica]
MIRKFINRVLNKDKATTAAKILPFKEHQISREQLSFCALKVTDGLQSAGFSAFVVGGAVRDLLMGTRPKDFDVATNATPEQVQALFRRSRIIGRRFRIVHVMCGSETIEVSTFRAAPSEEDGRKSDENGRILRDNVFGCQEDDAVRRDFTINALYYNPATQEIWDTQNGVRDLKHKTLRIIGDPEQRYREDPVRMLRAVRFAAKLDFHIDERTRAPVAELANLLENVPSSRLFDEMLKLLLSGHALRAVHQLRAEGLHHGLLPLLDVVLEQPMGERFITLALKNTDERVKIGKTVSPGFLFATLLWHEVLAAWQAYQAKEAKPVPALQLAMDDVMRAQEQRLAIPRRFDANMKEIWGMQPRFEQRSGGRPFRLLSHPRFRAGYDFLLLRCESGEATLELGKWWEKFQSATEHERSDMLIADTVPKKKRRRRKNSAQSVADVPSSNQDQVD